MVSSDLTKRELATRGVSDAHSWLRSVIIISMD